MNSLDIFSLIKSVPDIDLQVIYGSEFIKFRNVTSPRIQRPGLALAGYHEHIRTGRVELFGETEINYLKMIDKESRLKNLSKLAEINKTVFIVSKRLALPEELLQAAQRHEVPILTSDKTTVEIYNELVSFFDYELAPETHIHGVFIEVNGLGIIIIGKSGIGKSECALELVKSGSRLIADDVVTVKKCYKQLIGTSNELLQNHIELRGVGILNLTDMFGITSVCKKKQIDLIIEFIDYNEWNDRENTDRLGLNNAVYNVLGIDVPLLLCPVSPGRNMAEIVELAARNHLLKVLGHDSSLNFTNNVNIQLNKEN